MVFIGPCDFRCEPEPVEEDAELLDLLDTPLDENRVEPVNSFVSELQEEA